MGTARLAPVSAARSRAAGILLSRVAGPDPTAARARIHLSPGPRWFARDSAIGRVHGDASMFVGGVRALLLQSLHPAAMAAVADHSDYRTDPWGRLARTATFLATTTFGPAEDAAQAVAVVRAVHDYLSGTTDRGEPYRVSDPHLLTWVHVAEVDSFLTAHQHLGARPLDRAGCEEYVAQAAVVARELGAADVPVTLEELDEVLASYRAELRPTVAAAQAAEFLLRDPPLPWFARPVYGLITGAAVGLMPAWSRGDLGLRRAGVRDRLAVRLGGRAVTGTIRWALASAEPRLPEGTPGPVQAPRPTPGAAQGPTPEASADPVS